MRHEDVVTELSVTQVLAEIQGGLCGEPVYHDERVDSASLFRYPCGLTIPEVLIDGILTFGVPVLRFAHDKHHVDEHDRHDGEWMIYGDFQKMPDGGVEVINIHCQPREGVELPPEAILQEYRTQNLPTGPVSRRGFVPPWHNDEMN
jgi:hypothetical protein